MLHSLLILAAALQSAAPAPLAEPATWESATVGDDRSLRGATAQQPGNRIIFLCNNENRLIAMLFRLHDDSQAAANAIASGHWLIDSTISDTADPRPIIPGDSHIISLVPVEPTLLNRLLRARAAGFVWTGGDGATLASYQIEMAGGRAQLIEFARACDSEAYR